MNETTDFTNNRILLVDDDQRTVQLVSAYLKREGYEVYTAASGDEAVRVAREALPALVVLDLMLPGLSGLEVCAVLRQEMNPLIIMLTALTTEEDTVVGLEAGADDYISKPFSPRELTARVRAVLRRTAARPNDSGGSWGQEVALDGLVLNPGTRRVFVDEREVTVTPVEFRILLLLVQHPGQVFSRAQLIDRVFGYEYDGLDRTIDAHIKNLRRKIERDRTAPRYVRTMFGAGYYCDSGTHR